MFLGRTYDLVGVVLTCVTCCSSTLRLQKKKADCQPDNSGTPYHLLKEQVWCPPFSVTNVIE
jgi:hypothetical protein